MHLSLETATHLSLSCNVFTLFPLDFCYILLIFAWQKIPSGCTPNQLKKSRKEVLGSGRCPLGLCLDICRGDFLLSEQWSPLEKDSKPLSVFGICQGYEVQQHATKPKFLLAYMKKTEQDMWACKIPSCLICLFVLSVNSGFQKWNNFLWFHNRQIFYFGPLFFWNNWTQLLEPTRLLFIQFLTLWQM